MQIAVYMFVNHLLLGDPATPFSPRSFRGLFDAEFHLSLVIYWSLVGLRHAHDYYRRYRERERLAAQLELEASQLEAQLAQAQLDALRMQLHPHFPFNISLAKAGLDRYWTGIKGAMDWWRRFAPARFRVQFPNSAITQGRTVRRERRRWIGGRNPGFRATCTLTVTLSAIWGERPCTANRPTPAKEYNLLMAGT